MGRQVAASPAPLSQTAAADAANAKPANRSLLQELIELYSAEVDGHANERDDLRVCAALLWLEGVGDVERAASYLTEVAHPLAPSLRLEIALSSANRQLLRSLTEEARQSPPAHSVELGLTLLGLPGEASMAADLLRADLSLSLAPVEVRQLALAMAGRWQELVDLLVEQNESRALVAAAALAEIHLHDTDQVRRLIEQAWQTRSGATDPYLVERMIELGHEVVGYRAKRELLDAGQASTNSIETLATEYALATALEAAGEVAEAAELVDLVCSVARPFGVILTWRLRQRMAARRGNFARVTTSLETLAQLTDSPLWRRAYLRRAADFAERETGDPERTVAILRRLYAEEPANTEVAYRLVHHAIVNGQLTEAAELLRATAQAHSSTRAALAALVLGARLTEVMADVSDELVAKYAQDIRQRLAAEATDSAMQRHALESLRRAYRRLGDRKSLIDVYAQLGKIGIVQQRELYLSVAGGLALDSGELEQAELSFLRALELNTNDCLAQLGCALIYRQRGCTTELVTALRALGQVARSSSVRAFVHRELARLATESDRLLAEESYERAVELEPQDRETLARYIQLCDQLGRWARAIALRELALRSSNGAEAAELACEIGAIYERHLHDDDNAANAYERALGYGDWLPAFEALASLLRRQKRSAELIALRRRQATLISDPTQRLELELEIAKLADGLEGATEEARQAYLAVLLIDPNHARALVRLEHLCRSEGAWELLAEVSGRAAPTVSILRTRAEALEHLGRWPEVVAVRREELVRLVEPKEVAQAAAVLGNLYERHLGDLQAALAAWRQVIEIAPEDLEALGALVRLHESLGNLNELAEVIERELRLEERNEPARRLELWLKLGEVRQRLGRLEGAAEAYERALAVDPANNDALSALADLYGTLGRSEDLNRVLDHQSETAYDPHQRTVLMKHKGRLLEKSGDLEAALAVYGEAFAIDPASRSCFTALERGLQQRESWPKILELYRTSIQLVEDGHLQSYRLADLYARKGQLELKQLEQPLEAAKSYLRVLELDPDSDLAQTQLEAIYTLFSDWQSLLGAYERRSALVKDPARRVDIYRRAARIAASRLKDPVEAARLYQLLLELEPADAEALEVLERHYTRAQDWEPLLAVMIKRQALATSEEEEVALLFRMAQTYEDEVGDAARATAAYEAILERVPTHTEAIDALGRLYESTEKWGDLVEITRRQVRYVSDRAQKALLYFKCGSVMESKFGNQDDAIRYYEAAIQASTSCLPAVHGLRDLHLRRQDWLRVIQTLELEAKLWTENKERAGVFAHIGQIYGSKLDDQELAIRYYERALEVDRDCLPANRALFELYFASGDYNMALPIVRQLTKKAAREGDPTERSEFYRKRAIVSACTGDPTEAAESLVVALEIDPENGAALELLVEVFRSTPNAYDFATVFRELEKLYRRRNPGGALARVLVGQGLVREVNFDVDGALAFYAEARQLNRQDYMPVEASVNLNEQLRRFNVAVALLEEFIAEATELETRTAARYRLAEIFGDGVMDAVRAILTLSELLKEKPDHQAAYFRIAQELYLVDRYVEANHACQTLIDLAAAPDHTAPPEELARYYDYLGRIAEAAGDSTLALRSYRRAAELDPAYAPTCLALARRAITAGDRAQAQRVLDGALQEAIGRGLTIELPLRREIGRFYASLGEVDRAIEVYRTLVDRNLDSADDRVALTELYIVIDDLERAQAVAEELLEADLRNLPAYRLLLQLYQRGKQLERAARVGAVLSLLGLVDLTERPPPFFPDPKLHPLSKETRQAYLLSPSATAYAEPFQAVRVALDQAYPVAIPRGAVALSSLGDPTLRTAAAEVQRLLNISADIYVTSLPQRMFAVESPRAALYLDHSLVESPARFRFVLGRGLEWLRSGGALFARLAASDRLVVTRLLEQLLLPTDKQEDDVRAFLARLPRKMARAVQKLKSSKPPLLSPGISVAEWLLALDEASLRAGLLACDDPAEAGRGQLTLHGEPPDPILTLGQIPDGEKLLRFFLSDGYHRLRRALGGGDAKRA